MSEKMEFDVIVIGAGPGGLSAALWCDELGLNTLLIEGSDSIGGQLNRVYNPIENHLGTKAKDGSDLIDRFSKQIADCKFKTRFNSLIDSVDIETLSIRSGEEEFNFRYLIIATGVRRRTLGIESETKFIGRGILHSGKRDGARIRGERVAVIGGGDAAIENALILAEHAEKVFVVNRSERFRAREEFLAEIRVNKKIEIYTNTEVACFIGDQNLECLELIQTTDGKKRRLDVAGVLLRVGVQPNSEFAADVIETDEEGYFLVDRFGQSSQVNIFAIGDVANQISPTISTSIGTAATAAKRILNLIEQE